MPLPLAVSCFSKIQTGFTFLVPAHLGSPGKRAVKRVCVCIYIHTPHRQRWLFSSTSTYHSTELLTARGVAHPVVHGTSGSTSCKTIPTVRSDSSGDVLSTVDMVVQRRDGPRRLRNHDDDDLYQGTGAGTGTGTTVKFEWFRIPLYISYPAAAKRPCSQRLTTVQLNDYCVYSKSVNK